jgi:hypothetical protein
MKRKLTIALGSFTICFSLGLLLLVTNSASASTFIGGTGVWTLATPITYYSGYYNSTYINHLNTTVRGSVYLVAENSVGQTVYYSECVLTLEAFATGSCANVVIGLPAGTYNASVFVVAKSGIAISNSTSVAFTWPHN